MALECLLVAFSVRIYLDCLVDSCLPPEQRDRPSDQQMAEAGVPGKKELLRLAKVSDVALNINSSGVEAGPSLHPTSPRDQDILEHVS